MALLNRKPRLGRKLEQPSASAYYLSQWGTGKRLVEIPHPRDEFAYSSVKPRIRHESVKEQFRVLAKNLCREHPAISSDSEILGGTPHIKNTRLSVGSVLAKLYLYGNIQAVLDIYEPHLSEEQVKEALAYAQDFLEMAFDTNEP